MNSRTRPYPQTTPKPGKCDIIEGILLGGKGSTNALNAKNDAETYKAEKIIGRLNMIVNNSSDHHAKAQATKAIDLLQLLSNSFVSEVNRRRIFEAVTNL